MVSFDFFPSIAIFGNFKELFWSTLGYSTRHFVLENRVDFVGNFLIIPVAFTRDFTDWTLCMWTLCLRSSIVLISTDFYSISLGDFSGIFHLFPQLTFCINLGVKLRTFGNFFSLFGKGGKIPGLNKGPQAKLSSYPARPVSQSLGPVSQAVVQQRSLAQQLHNLLGTRHPATQAQPAQLSSCLATSGLPQ